MLPATAGSGAVLKNVPCAGTAHPDVVSSVAMQHVESWRPSKIVKRGTKWVGSPLASELGIGSRLIGDIQAATYQRVIEAHARGRLLDVGCGKVPLFGIYSPLATEIVCVDWPHSMHGSQHVDQFVDLNRPLPFEGAQFDTILSTDVLEHIGRPDVLWREIARLLRPGGKIILTVPFLYSIHEEPHDYFRYTAYKLRQFCDDNNLQVIELEPYGGALEVILDIVGKHLYRHRMLSRLHLAASRMLLKIKPLKAISDDTMKIFPLGYCLVAEKPMSGSKTRKLEGSALARDSAENA